MSEWVFLLNGISVTLFGSILAASFCNSLSSGRNLRILFLCVSVPLILQGVLVSFFDVQILRYIYPLMIHLPLILILYYLTGKKLWSFVSVLSAYMCCQLRRWIALLVVFIVSGEELLQSLVELIITVPLLLFLLKMFSPVFRAQSEMSFKIQYQFIVIPALYYIFDYVTVVYTDLLESGSPVAVEFMPFVCCVSYLVFLMYHYAEDKKQAQLRQTQKILDIQINQSVREISALRKSQALAKQYRHDLRHHLQYVSSCIKNGQLDHAKTYISGICKEIEAQKVDRYCENEAANLILSSFAGQAKKNNITMNVRSDLPAVINVSENDLCVLLSNVLENAIHSCQKLSSDETGRIIDVKLYMQNEKMFLQVINSCGKDVRFENGVPVNDEPDHGIGVQSICTIAERYGGIYSFSVQDGQFILRLSI